jgi:hypothetical protein
VRNVTRTADKVGKTKEKLRACGVLGLATVDG